MFRSFVQCLLCLAVIAVPPIVAGAQGLGAGEPSRTELRHAVAEQGEQIRADEAMAGRRLTPAERAELRAQLRREWAARNEATQTAETVAPAAPSGSGGRHSGGGWRAFWPWAFSTSPQ
ncbi:MAG: hypothetical protein QM586_11720 [Xenophilus sp.]